MIFENIEKFEKMSDEELLSCINSSSHDRVKIDIKKPRSAMMLNPLKLKHLNNIDNLEADIIVLNLEDGVAKELKQRALYLSAVFISHLKSSKSRVIVRVNPIDDGGEQEIEFLNSIKPDCIRVAKIKTKKDVEKVLEILSHDIGLNLSIETKEALENLTKLNIQNRVQTVSLGIMDMLNSLGLSHSLLEFNNPTITYILTKFLIDAKIANIYPIGFTYQDYLNIEDFIKWCEFEKSLGLSCKSCLGPKQVEIANQIFSHDNEEIKKAKYIKDRFEDMQDNYITGFMDATYGFIDEPIYKDAMLTLKG